MKNTNTEKMNDQDHGGREKNVNPQTNHDEPSRASHGSFSSGKVHPQLREWIEKHNLEYEWNWNDLESVRREMNAAAGVSGAFDLVGLIDLFNRFAQYKSKHDQ